MKITAAGLLCFFVALLFSSCARQPAGLSQEAATAGDGKLQVKLTFRGGALSRPFFLISARDGRKWEIPTRAYDPFSRNDRGEMHIDYFTLKQFVAPTREIVALQESGEGEDFYRTVIFISSEDNVARAYAITSGKAPDPAVRTSRFPVLWFQNPIQDLQDDGIVIRNVLIPWDKLDNYPIGTWDVITNG